MFNNIIYFIIVLLIFNISYPDKNAGHSLTYGLTMHFAGWLIFASYCGLGFRRLMGRLREDRNIDGRLTNEYHSLILKLSVLAIFLFALDVYLFQLKYWLQIIPGSEKFLFFQGIVALALFLFYLSTIWYFSHPVYRLIFQAEIDRASFIASNLKLNLPILFPWLTLSLVYDLVSFSPWEGPENLLNRPWGQILFFAVFLVVLMIFMPRFVQYGWGCRPFEKSERIMELEDFLHERGFRYRNILRWPIFEGRMMTAGIMGVVPRYRYILITDSLMEMLSVEELKAVMAHEMGHAKYLHMLFYILFVLGYMVLSLGLFESDLYFLLGAYVVGSLFDDVTSTNLLYLIVSLPILVTMIVYFRYVMGFFMRHFERQADLYSAVIMRSPRATISSLEKIAFLSGKSREVPSWHHFSIKERVEYLWKTISEPRLVSRHSHFVAFAFGLYLILMGGLAYFLNFSPLKHNVAHSLIARVAYQQLQEEPDNIHIYESLAMFHYNAGEHGDAIGAYEKIIAIDPEHAGALNNLAWILVTSPEEGLQDTERGLVLAKKAVKLEKSPIFLDTLAEAYYANGLRGEAVRHIKEAISLATENREYYQKQLRKFIADAEKE